MKVSWGWQHPMAVKEVAVHPPLPLAGVPVQQEGSWSHTGSPLQVASTAHALPDSQDHPGGGGLQLWGGEHPGDGQNRLMLWTRGHPMLCVQQGIRSPRSQGTAT